MKILHKIDAILIRVENFLLLFLLTMMILLAFLQIPLSRFIPMEDVEVLLRHLVLWVGLLGATIATHEGKHINIDALSRFLKGRRKNIILFLSNLFSVLVCSLLTYASWVVVKDSREFAESVKIFIEVPTWALQLILLIGFGIMTFRFFIKALDEVGRILKPGRAEK